MVWFFKGSSPFLSCDCSINCNSHVTVEMNVEIILYFIVDSVIVP